MAVSNNSQVILSTYALGSCIGLIAYDPAVKVGGILHLMLPESTISPEKAARQPAMFADTGLPLFFRQLFGVKGDKSRLRLLVAGGASVIAGTDPFRIGERNTRYTQDFLAQNGLTGVRSEIGGNINRTVHLELSTGKVTLKTPVENRQILLCP